MALCQKSEKLSGHGTKLHVPQHHPRKTMPYDLCTHRTIQEETSLRSRHLSMVSVDSRFQSIQRLPTELGKDQAALGLALKVTLTACQHPVLQTDL